VSSVRRVLLALATQISRNLTYSFADFLPGPKAENPHIKPLFTLWKDADPDIPILKQAKAEYAKLQ
jgi:hypothetical protein